MTTAILVALALTTGWWARARVDAHRSEEAGWDETKARAFAHAGDRLYDQLDLAGRLLAEKDALVGWLTGAVHDQADRLRHTPRFHSRHAVGRF